MASRVDSDRRDFATRQRAVAQSPAVDEVAGDLPQPGSPPFEGIDLIAADALSDLGFDDATIKLILLGPRHVSIHQIGNPQLPGEVHHGEEGTLEKEPPEARPPRPAPRPEDLYWPTPFGQAAIVQAVWANLHGDPMALAEISKGLADVPPVLRAYLAAAIVAGQRDYVGLEKWKTEFDREQAKLEAARSKQTKETESAVAAVVGAAAAAANAIPAVGQVVSAALALGLAIREALISAFPVPGRQAVDQIRDGHEGTDTFWGLRSTSDGAALVQERYRTAKQWVVQDPVAFQLPPVPLRTAFAFAPTTDDFKEAASKLGLYPNE